jgi:hypothetical protein
VKFQSIEQLKKAYECLLIRCRAELKGEKLKMVECEISNKIGDLQYSHSIEEYYEDYYPDEDDEDFLEVEKFEGDLTDVLNTTLGETFHCECQDNPFYFSMMEEVTDYNKEIQFVCSECATRIREQAKKVKKQEEHDEWWDSLNKEEQFKEIIKDSKYQELFQECDSLLKNAGFDIEYVSKSGSVYYHDDNDNRFRVSDHEVKDNGFRGDSSYWQVAKNQVIFNRKNHRGEYVDVDAETIIETVIEFVNEVNEDEG